MVRTVCCGRRRGNPLHVLNPRPIEAVEQGSECHRRQPHHPIYNRWPLEGTLLMVLWRSSATCPVADNKRSKDRPFLIAHQQLCRTTSHGKAGLNHGSSKWQSSLSTEPSIAPSTPCPLRSPVRRRWPMPASLQRDIKRMGRSARRAPRQCFWYRPSQPVCGSRLWKHRSRGSSCLAYRTSFGNGEEPRPE